MGVVIRKRLSALSTSRNPLVCSTCLIYGHLTDSCLKIVNDSKRVINELDETKDLIVGNDFMKQTGSRPNNGFIEAKNKYIW